LFPEVDREQEFTLNARVIAQDTTCRGSAIQRAAGGKMLSGTLMISGDRLRFDAGDVAVEMSLDGLELRAGGHNDEQLFFGHVAQPEWILNTSDHAILDQLTPAADAGLQARIRAVTRRKASMGSRFLVASLSVILVVVFGGVLLISQKSRLARLAASHVPITVEEQFGDAVFQSVKQQTKIIEDPRWTAQLGAVSARLLPAVANTGYHFRFHVAESDELNAFAIPGGHVVVYTGLLKAVKRPEELAGVLAHELSHVTGRHSLRNLIETLGLGLIVQTIFGDASGLVAAASRGSETLLRQKFSRDAERAADDAGWDLMLAADVDPRGMIEFFRTMQAELAGNPAALATEKQLNFLSTHPATAERIERLEARWQAMSSKTGFIPLGGPAPELDKPRVR
jgi:Zn-dependent protease with chaperone function